MPAAPFEARNACAVQLRIPADISRASIDSRLCFGFNRSIARENHPIVGPTTRSLKRVRSTVSVLPRFPYVAAERIRARRARAGIVATFAIARTESVRQRAATKRSTVTSPLEGDDLLDDCRADDHHHGPDKKQ